MKKENKKVKITSIKKIGNIDYADLPFKQYRNIGNIKNNDNYEHMAGKKVGIAILWIPKMLFFCKICCGVSLFSLIVIFISIYKTPSPTVFLNYQDGTLLCSPNPIDIKTGKKYPREESKYESLCNSLNNFTKGEE